LELETVETWNLSMSTALQLIIVFVLIALAAAYVLRAAWKTWFGASKSNCGSGCGKCNSSAPEPQVKGRRPLPMA
jgi:hypothetical protein